MLRTHKITAALGYDNIISFSVSDEDGNPIDFDDLSVTQIKVIVCSCASNAEIDASWSGSIVNVAFGNLALPVGNYKPKIVYYSALKPDGEVIAGESFLTQIDLKLVC